MAEIKSIEMEMEFPKPKSESKRENILDAAKVCVLKDRNTTCGEPEDNFKTIAEYWSTYLDSTYKDLTKISFSSTDVAIMMILVKISRLAKSPQLVDHWIDIAGYSACGGECAIK